MSSWEKETRRIAAQVGNLVRHGRLNPYPRTRRRNKPAVLRARPDWEIASSLEFVATHFARNARDFLVVQVGAFDGDFDDPIAHLIREHGWRALLVEPQPGAFEALRLRYADQPQVLCENAAIADHDGEVTLYALHTDATPMASFDRRHLIRHAQRPSDIVERRVPCLTLRSLLDKHGINKVDLLQIDAEGYDAEIVRSIDFGTMRPTIIRYEHANLCESDRGACIELLAAQGYRILLEDSDTMAVDQTVHPTGRHDGHR